MTPSPHPCWGAAAGSSHIFWCIGGWGSWGVGGGGVIPAILGYRGGGVLGYRGGVGYFAKEPLADPKIAPRSVLKWFIALCSPPLIPQRRFMGTGIN